MTVFVDTSALFALLHAESEEHPRAKATMRALIEREEPLVTHNYVVVESLALLQRRLGRGAVRALIDDVLPEIELAWVDATTHTVGIAALLAAAVPISLVDLVSFAIMRERGIRAAFAFDTDFTKAGFTLLP